MKIKINNDILDFKLISGKSNQVSFVFEDEIFSISKEDLKKSNIITSMNVNKVQINAYEHVLDVQEINEHRNKDLKIYTQITVSPTSMENRDLPIVAAIMKAYLTSNP